MAYPLFKAHSLLLHCGAHQSCTLYSFHGLAKFHFFHIRTIMEMEIVQPPKPSLRMWELPRLGTSPTSMPKGGI